MYEREWSETALIGWNRGGPDLKGGPLHICAVCFTWTEATFVADTDTHRILNRSEEPTHGIGLCVKCWSRLLRD